MTYRIPERNLERLKADIAKLNKRARKLGVQAIQMTISTTPEEVEVPRTQEEIELAYPRKYMRVFEVEVTGNTPKFQGWTFGATVQHTEEGNVLRKAPGIEVELTSYREGQPLCEHCQTRRRRNDTFIVIHDDGTTKQIGRNCVRDFLGHQDPDKLAKEAELIFSLGEMCGNAEDYDGFGGGGGVDRVSLEGYLWHVAEFVIQQGFVSGKATREIFEKTGASVQSTAGRAWSNMRPTREQVREGRVLVISDDAKALAAKSIEYVLETLDGKPELNDFEHNMLILAKCESIEPRNSGLAAYLVQHYRRSMEKATERANQPQSNFFGEVKTRYRAQVLTYAATINLPDNGYGERMLHKLLDAAGNVYIWVTNSAIYRDDGVAANISESVTMDFTVKAHSEYRGVKQTLITRCKTVAAAGLLNSRSPSDPRGVAIHLGV